MAVIGDFEMMILMAIKALGDNAYGVPIRKEMERHGERDIAVGALYTVLNRLEEKGMVRSWESEKTAKRGGRAKRYYALEQAGLDALDAKYQEALKTVELLKPSHALAGA